MNHDKQRKQSKQKGWESSFKHLVAIQVPQKKLSQHYKSSIYFSDFIGDLVDMASTGNELQSSQKTIITNLD